MTMSAIGLLSRVASLMCWFMLWLGIGNATGLLSAMTMQEMEVPKADLVLGL